MTGGEKWRQPEENSIEALVHGINFSDGVEFDLRMDCDGELVIFHDEFVPGEGGIANRCIENMSTSELRSNGVVVFEDLISSEKIDRILEAWKPIRNADIKRQGENPPRGWGRYNVRVPFREPFVDQEIFDHPAVVQFLEQVLCGPLML